MIYCKLNTTHKYLYCSNKITKKLGRCIAKKGIFMPHGLTYLKFLIVFNMTYNRKNNASSFNKNALNFTI